MKNALLILIFTAGTAVCQTSYFQQHVAYDIEVTLDDSSHTLTADQKIVYTNHSPDTLSFVWFHLWPNAYRDESSAFARQQARLGNSRFADSEEDDKGFIDSLDFSVDGIRADWEFHADWNDVAKVHLPKPLFPEESVTI